MVGIVSMGRASRPRASASTTGPATLATDVPVAQLVTVVWAGDASMVSSATVYQRTRAPPARVRTFLLPTAQLGYLKPVQARCYKSPDFSLGWSPTLAGVGVRWFGGPALAHLKT